jgi:zinc transporter
VEPQQGLIHAFVLDGKGGARPLDWEGIGAWTADQGTLWVHLDIGQERARTWLSTAYDLDPVITEALLDEETRPRCDSAGEGLLINLRGVNVNPGAEPEDMVSLRLYADADRVITARHRRLLTIGDIVTALEAGTGPKNAGGLVATLADRLTERMSDVVGELDDRIDDLEEAAIAGSDPSLRGNLLDIRREIIMLRRYLAPQREALKRIQTAQPSWMAKRDRLRVREAGDQLTRYVEDLDSAKDRAAVAYEALSSQLAEQMNSRMYVLSLVAGVFLPLGFLTGLLGINVGGIPLADDPLGFFWVALSLALLVLIQVIVFRRLRWF